MIHNTPDGATLIRPSDKAYLIPKHLTTQPDLDAWEKRNIANAKRWASGQNDILSISFIKTLHQKMFNETWKWAGKFRTIELNLGVAWPLINEETKKLCDNVLYHLEHKVYSLEEIAVRFHHKLAWIHPFHNGNGRHARHIADLLLEQNGHKCLSWGNFQDLQKNTTVRTVYIDAMKEADQGLFEKLLNFAHE